MLTSVLVCSEGQAHDSAIAGSRLARTTISSRRSTRAA
jgi:hypothetical protein